MRPQAHVLLAAALLAGCGETAPPSRPAWDQHVMPLLQGRCNGCHGETVGQQLNPDSGMPIPPATRLDICMPDTPAFREAGITAAGGAAAFLKMFFDTQLEPDKKTGRALMPPPPAEPLSSYEYAVLKKWVEIVKLDDNAACLKAVRNRAPQVTLVEPPMDTGEAVQAIVDVTDADNDGVRGKATLGSATIEIPGAGRRTLRFPRGTPAGGTLSVVVSDGYDTGRL